MEDSLSTSFYAFSNQPWSYSFFGSLRHGSERNRYNIQLPDELNMAGAPIRSVDYLRPAGGPEKNGGAKLILSARYGERVAGACAGTKIEGGDYPLFELTYKTGSGHHLRKVTLDDECKPVEREFVGKGE